jgi:hypothetical protein
MFTRPLKSLSDEEISNIVFELRLRYKKIGFIDCSILEISEALKCSVEELTHLVGKNDHPHIASLPVKPITTVILDVNVFSSETETYYLSSVPIDEYPKWIWRPKRMSKQLGDNRWRLMNERCNQTWNPAYHNYGARGIKVCDAWHYLNPYALDNYNAWLYREISETGQDTSVLFDVDRRDNDGCYCPSNCRLLSRTENMQNTRFSKLTFEQVAEMRNVLRDVPKEERTKYITKYARANGLNDFTIERAVSGVNWTNIDAVSPPVELGGGSTGVRLCTDEMIISWRDRMRAVPREERSAVFDEIVKESIFSDGCIRDYVTGIKGKHLDNLSPPVLTRKVITTDLLKQLCHDFLQVRDTVTLNQFCISKSAELNIARGALYNRLHKTIPETLWRLRYTKKP